MPIIFYHANFCPECGNRHEALSRRWLQQRYFCPACARQLGHRWDWLPLAIAVGGVLLGVLLPLRPRPVTLPPVTPSSANLVSLTAPSVSAQDATAQLKPAPLVPMAVSYQCGARTQKGTACKHRVAEEGQRCFQHQGRRSILK